MILRFTFLCLSAILPLIAHADMVDTGADLKALPQVPEGFEVKIFAQEPLVRQTCSMAFDGKGRLFVGMGPQYRNPTPETPGDSVCLIEDKDGDGVADSNKVFATGLNCVQGLAWHGRDLWVANAPDLTIVRDLDGDDVADEYVKVFTDLGNIEHSLHGLVWAPDGKLYMSKGNSKGLNKEPNIAPAPFRELFGQSTTTPATKPQTVKASDYKPLYQNPQDDWGLMGGVLRCDDLGENLEIVSRGMRNPWDIAHDDGFNWLGTDNDQNEGDRVMMPFYGAHFGWNHPWSSHWTGENHLPTAPVSHKVFHGSGTGIVFGSLGDRRGVFFINDWLNKTTFVFKPKWDGALMTCEGGEWQPFIVGGKSLFRPTDLAFGPDGALYAAWLDGRDRGQGKSGSASLYIAKSTNRGQSFEKSVRVALNVCPCCRPSLAFTDAKTLHIGWRGVMDGDVRDVFVATSTDGGATFTTGTRVADDNWQLNGCPHTGPTLATMGGRLFVAWRTVTGARARLYLASSNDNGAHFSGQIAADANLLDANHPRLLPLGNSLGLVFQAREAATQDEWSKYDIYFRQIDKNGALTPLQHLKHAVGSATYPTLLFERPDHLFIAWTEGSEEGRKVVLARGRLSTPKPFVAAKEAQHE